MVGRPAAQGKVFLARDRRGTYRDALVIKASIFHAPFGACRAFCRREHAVASKANQPATE